MSNSQVRLQQYQQHLLPNDPVSHYNETKVSGVITPVFSTEACPPAGPYSQAVKTTELVFCSGQLPTDSNGVLTSGTIAQKTESCIKNLKAILETAGSEIEKVVKVTVFLSDMKYFIEMNSEYEKWFSHKPARSCIAVKGLPKNVDVEIEAIAIL